MFVAWTSRLFLEVSALNNTDMRNYVHALAPNHRGLSKRKRRRFGPLTSVCCASFSFLNNSALPFSLDRSAFWSVTAVVRQLATSASSLSIWAIALSYEVDEKWMSAIVKCQKMTKKPALLVSLVLPKASRHDLIDQSGQ